LLINGIVQGKHVVGVRHSPYGAPVLDVSHPVEVFTGVWQLAVLVVPSTTLVTTQIVLHSACRKQRSTTMQSMYYMFCW